MTRASGVARLSAPTAPAVSATPATWRASGRRTDGVPPLSEKDFQRQVTDLGEVLGWDWAHFRPAQTARGWRTPVSGTIGEGWVDLVLVRARDRRLVFAELKSDRGAVSPRQMAVLDILRSLACPDAPRHGFVGMTHAEVEVHVWRPSDLRDPIETSRIYSVLR